MKISRAKLEELWGEATGLDDAKTSPLTKAIIQEAIEGGGDVPHDVCDAIYRIARDCEDFADAIARWANS